MNRFFLYLFVIFFLQSCSSVVYRHVTNRLGVGMVKNEVIEAIGSKPVEKRYFGDSELMVYYIHSSIFDLIFSKNFPYFGFYPFNLTGEEFWVVLKNDKVESFGYARNYGYSFGSLGN